MSEYTDIPDDTKDAATEIVGRMGGIVSGNDRAEILAFILHIRDRATREQAFTEAKADCRASHTVEVQRLNAVTAERDSLKAQVQEMGKALASLKDVAQRAGIELGLVGCGHTPMPDVAKRLAEQCRSAAISAVPKEAE